jgi:signal transduction histidine kinase
LTLLATLALVAAVRLVRRSPWTLTARVGALLVGMTAYRMLLLAVRVPERWQQGKAPLAPMFDPTHLASDMAFGLFRSVGDLALTVVLLAVLAVIVVSESVRQAPRIAGERAHLRAAVAGFLAAAGFLPALLITRRMLLDSTLDYFARSGLLPQRLVVLVFGALLVATLGFVLLASAGALRWMPARIGRREGLFLLAGALLAAAAGFLLPVRSGPGELAAMALFAAAALMAGRRLRDGWTLQLLHLRSLLLGVVLLAVGLYPVMDRGQEYKERQRMVDAAIAYTASADPRVQLAMDQVLRDAADAALDGVQDADSLMDALLRSSLIASLGTYDVSAALLDEDGYSVGRSVPSRSSTEQAGARLQDRDDLLLMRAMRPDNQPGVPRVERITDPVERDRFDFVGVVQVAGDRWVLVRAAQHNRYTGENTPFPRVLIPAGYYGSLYPDLSIAQYRDGILMRSFGSAFGRSYLDPSVSDELARNREVWRTESVRERTYTTYYARAGEEAAWGDSSPSVVRSTVAVRRARVNVFDRLYYLLRLTVSGVIFGIPVYLVGLGLRIRRGLVPARHVRFRDKVLNAFFAVGLVVVTAMGVLGMRVVTGENERAIESWLRQHLDRVEDALAMRATIDELPYRVLERTDIDSLAAQVGLDLNVYRGVDLEMTSLPQLVRDRLISTRLPIQAYSALYVDGFRFVDVDERLGRFRYTAGYRALPDEQGVPRYIVSVPTLPEQERIEEERARTVAYLFGALLLLMMVVMVTAAVIANTLASPLARLRRGLESVAEGRFERIGPMDTRDEIGDLVGAFNDMQDQLAESRRLLARHERQLAWREMARQVAHEIKNPLTPMKLSVQHLRRAFDPTGDADRFRVLFDRITATLMDQIDALARIANEFSSFARMPQQQLEALDLNEVMRDAAALMLEHATVDLEDSLSGTRLPVEGDREAVRRVFIDFVKNAMEAF